MSNNDIRICDKCRHIKMKTFLPKVEKLDPNTEVKVGCKSYCGPCQKRVFIYINGRYITGATEEEAIEKAKQYVK
ncbi:MULTISPECIES: DUF1450 domain-containing protein [Paenibacillus]|uniref:DUF1450 domain-containing protein n=2 Tax=Paenibacillus TaxID=44249 RepID=A0A559IY09_9BACL|nr:MULTISPECIES: DUF1450 domain-containing protein [Paenibacillus]MBD8498602.1 DUF1450 domain-containing protein [Paenibacillus arenosi]TVX92519.1 DUF1450 domain-containing protein [Paenibacillus agilis]